ncbi:TRAP-type C4-dicarboxylate transport system substrate-binding protein [Roseovarius sp. MBR-154]|jgi:TRAP-type C4-dicarboxylate transport system substrate-binding protein
MTVNWKTTIAAAGVAALTAIPALAQDMTLKQGHLANEDNPWHLASVTFGGELSALTDGRIAESTWATLSEEDRGHVMEAASRAQTHERELFNESIAADRAFLEEKDMTVVEVDGAAFQAAAKDAVLMNVNDEIKPIVEGLFSE